MVQPPEVVPGWETRRDYLESKVTGDYPTDGGPCPYQFGKVHFWRITSVVLLRTTQYFSLSSVVHYQEPTLATVAVEVPLSGDEPLTVTGTAESRLHDWRTHELPSNGSGSPSTYLVSSLELTPDTWVEPAVPNDYAPWSSGLARARNDGWLNRVTLTPSPRQLADTSDASTCPPAADPGRSPRAALCSWQGLRARDRAAPGKPSLLGRL